MGYSTQFWAPGMISMARDPPVYGNLEVVKIREFCHFWPFSWVILHCFFTPGTISTARVHGNLEVDKTREFIIYGCFHGL